ncbi:hypothetical protein ACP4OV_006704 [Aristida adscensionis]
MLRIHPHPAIADTVKCRIWYSSEHSNEHEVEARFKVECTDLSNGVPELDDRVHLVIPNCVHGDDKDQITVAFCLVQSPTVVS